MNGLEKYPLQVQQIVSALSLIALRRRELYPYAVYVTGPDEYSIPSGVTCFNIVNLGLDGDAVVFENIPITGILGTVEINKNLKEFSYSVEIEQNIIKGPITVSPESSHIVLIQFMSEDPDIYV